MAQNTKPVWLITGCSSGFGRELAKRVLERGYRAAITARSPQGILDITDTYGERALPLVLDVTEPAQVKEAVGEAESRFGGIDVLVNNAGYGLLAAVEESDETDVRAMFEANFFGLARMIHEVLPRMRHRRKGFIVNISSVGGLVGHTGVGYYNATKFAVEGLSEALAKEVEPLGLKVMIVEPGPFRTEWAGRSIKLPWREIPDYADTAGARRRMIKSNSGKQAGDPVRGAEAIIKAVESENPPLHLVLGKIGLLATREKLEKLQEELNSWEETTLGADFPESATT